MLSEKSKVKNSVYFVFICVDKYGAGVGFVYCLYYILYFYSIEYVIVMRVVFGEDWNLDV